MAYNHEQLNAMRDLAAAVEDCAWQGLSLEHDVLPEVSTSWADAQDTIKREREEEQRG